MPSYAQIHERFEQRIAEKQRQGLVFSQAAAQIEREDPRLYHLYMAGDPDDDDDEDRGDDDDQSAEDEEEKVAARKKRSQAGKKKSTAETQACALQTWKTRIAEKQRQGMSFSDARRAVDREHPDLRLMAIGQSPAASAATDYRPAAKQATRDFESAIAAKMKAGLSRANATAAVVKEQPQLRDRLLATTNAARAQR
jgi:hypothetical protein